MDRITKEARSRNMAKIRSKDTKPEVFLRKALHKAGFRYRLNCSKLPGKPDIVLKKYGAVIFVNGCFWHGIRTVPRARFLRPTKTFGLRRSGAIWPAMKRTSKSFAKTAGEFSSSGPVHSETKNFLKIPLKRQ